MGGGDSSQAHSSNPDKGKSKMSLCKLLTQRKTKVGCSKNRETTVVVELPPRPVVSPTRNMFRGYCDPETRTTRLSLCCAMTESSSHTPPHSHPLALSPQMEKSSSSSDEGAASMVVYTRDVASQTSFSPPARPKNEARTPETDPIDDLYDDTREYRNANFRSFSELSLNRVMSYTSTPGRSTDEYVSSTTTSTSSGMSSIPALPPRFSADPVMLSKSCARSRPDMAMYLPDYGQFYRRPTSQVIIRNRTVVAESVDNVGDGAPTDSLAKQALLGAQVLHLIPADKARERNFLQRRTGANSLLGSVELERALPNREINVFVGTWNMNGHPPPRGINDFMLPQGLDHVPDIFAIGTQESYHEKFEWEVKIQETIGPSHVLYHSTSLGTIHLAIFIRRDLLWFCSIAEESSLSVRPGAAFKTKGAVAIGFILFGTSFLFITAHLTAHHEKLKSRIHDIKRIIRSLDLPKNLPLRLRSKSKDVTQNFDSVFWCGDLNFRLSQPRDDVIHWVQGYKFPFVVDLRSDQLTKLITEGTCLSSFEEGQITFPPTYKYDPGTQNFDTSSKHRTPSYTDRILFKSRGGTVTCLAYYSVPRISTSDHKPVWGLYRGLVRPGIDTIPLTAGLFNREVYLEGIKRRAADMGRQKYGLSAVCCIQ